MQKIGVFGGLGITQGHQKHSHISRMAEARALNFVLKGRLY